MNRWDQATADVHVVPLDDGWEVRCHGELYPKSRHRSRRAAIKAGQRLAHETKTTLFIHGLDGRIVVDDRV